MAIAGTATLAARRIRRQWALRICLSVAIGALLAYALIPWYVSPTWLAGAVAGSLSQALRRPVHIEQIRLSWADGVAIEGLTIAEPPGPGRPPLFVRVRRAQCGLTPLTTLFFGKVDHLELDDAELWLAPLPDGGLNIDDIAARGQGHLPTVHYIFHDAVLHLDWPDLPTDARMDRLEVRLDRDTGVLHVVGDATAAPHSPTNEPQPQSGRFWLDGRLNVPRLKRGVQLSGGGSLRWENVDLARIPFRELPQLGVQSIEGKTDGFVRLETYPDLGVDYDMQVRVDGVSVRRMGEPVPERIQDGLIAARGHWDPNVDRLVADALSYELGAVRIHDVGREDRPALVLDRRAAETLRLDLAGDVADWQRLQRQFPAIEAFLKTAGITAKGQATFTVRLQRRQQRDLVRLVINATPSWLSWADDVRVQAGVPKELTAELQLGPQDRVLDVNELRFSVDDLRVGAQIEKMPLAEPSLARNEWLARVLRQTYGHFWFTTQHAEQLTRYVPGIERLIGSGERRGRLALAVDLRPQAGGTELTGHAECAADARLVIAPWFEKQAEAPMTADVTLTVTQHRPDRWRIDGRVVQGETVIAIEPQEAYVEWPSDRDADGAAAGRWAAYVPLRITNTAGAAGSVPVLREALAKYGAADECLRGDTLIAMRAAGPTGDRPRLDELTVRVDATPLSIALGEAFHKLAGQVGVITMTQTDRSAGDVRDERLDVAVDLPGLHLDTRRAVSGDRDAASNERPRERHVTGALSVHDAATAAAVVPALARRCARHDLAGGLRAQWALDQDALTNRLDVTLDASGLQLRDLAGGEIDKPANMPCRATVKASASPASGQTWTIESGQIEWASARASLQPSHVALATVWEDWWRAVRHGAAITAFPAAGPFEALDLAATFTAEAQTMLASTSPWLATVMDRLGWVGRVSGSAHLTSVDATTRLAALVDVGPSYFRVPLSGRLPIVKPIGVDANVAVDIAASPDRVTVHDLTLNIEGNRTRLSGELDGMAGVDVDSVSDAALTVAVDWPTIAHMNELLPDAPWPAMSGTARGAMTWNATRGQWTLDQSDLTLRQTAFATQPVPLVLSGHMGMEDGTLAVDDLDMRSGDGHVQVSGTIRGGRDHPSVQLGINSQGTDLDSLVAAIQSIVAQLPIDALAGSQGAVELDDPRLRQATIAVDVSVDRLRLTVPDLDVPAEADAGTIEVRGQDGVINMSFLASVDGGVVDGEITFYLNVPDPHFDLRYAVRGIAPEALAQRYLQRSFPGFVATGPVTIIDRSLQRLRAAPDEPNHPVGSGELIIEGGYVSGKAAPDWLTRIFPGLNLARYDFVRMHDWFTKHADGRADHRMIFIGKYYPLYMEGYTETDGNVRYEVGIDFLAQLDSQYWAETRQGRIPLFTKTGTLTKDGTLDPDIVHFTPMYRVVETLLVQNNVVITLYHAIRKEVLDAQRGKAAR